MCMLCYPCLSLLYTLQVCSIAGTRLLVYFMHRCRCSSHRLTKSYIDEKDSSRISRKARVVRIDAVIVSSYRRKVCCVGLQWDR